MSSSVEIPLTDLCLRASRENELLAVPLQMALAGSQLLPDLLAVPPQTQLHMPDGASSLCLEPELPALPMRSQTG